MTYIHIPERFNDLLNRQLAEVIIQTEKLADDGYIIMSNETIHQTLIKKSEKLKSYKFFKTYSEYSASINSNQSDMPIYDLCYEVQKTLFNLSQDEQLISKSLLSSQFHFSDYYLSEEDIIYFSPDRSSSNESEPKGFNIPLALSNTPACSNDFYHYRINNNIPQEICSIGFLLKALTINHEKDEPILHTSYYVAKNYLTGVISLINWFIDEDEAAHSFLTKEIYKAIRHYTIEDIDKHLTTDIPKIPYTNGQSDLKAVYYYKPETTDVCEFLFVTEQDYYSIKLKVKLPYADWYIETDTYQKNTEVNVFGLDIKLNETELAAIKGRLIEETEIKFIDNFIMNEEKFIAYLTNTQNHSIHEELREYYLLHRNAWLPDRNSPRSTYETSLAGMAEELYPQFTEENMAIQAAMNASSEKATINEAKMAYDLESVKYDDFDDFDFGNDREEITSPPPARERLCQQCLEELGMNEIHTQPKKQGFICEWCVEKRAMAQATVSEQDIKEAESLQTVVIEKREFKTSVKIVFWILVVALLAIAFT